MVPESERGRSRVCLWKRSDDLPELILGEGPERFRRNVPKRARRQREPGDDVVTWRLGDEDEVVSAQREVEPLHGSSTLLDRILECVDPTRTVLDLRNALLRVTRERDERGHRYLPLLLRPPPRTAQCCARRAN